LGVGRKKTLQKNLALAYPQKTIGPFLKGFRREEEGMATLQPKGEKVRQAVRWISEMRQEDDSKPVPLLIQKASAHFNLSPQDEEFLRAFYASGGVGEM
jgi:hypothetical protein